MNVVLEFHAQRMPPVFRGRIVKGLVGTKIEYGDIFNGYLITYTKEGYEKEIAIFKKDIWEDDSKIFSAVDVTHSPEEVGAGVINLVYQNDPGYKKGDIIDLSKTIDFEFLYKVKRVFRRNWSMSKMVRPYIVELKHVNKYVEIEKIIRKKKYDHDCLEILDEYELYSDKNGVLLKYENIYSK